MIWGYVRATDFFFTELYNVISNIPTTIILILVAIFYDSVKDNPYIAKAMIGVRIAVVPVILSAVLKMLKPAFPHLICILIAVAAFSAFFFFNINSLLIVGFGALVGYFFSALQEGEK